MNHKGHEVSRKGLICRCFFVCFVFFMVMADMM